MMHDLSRWGGVALASQNRWRVTRNDEGDRVLKGRHGVISVYPDGDLDVWVTNIRVAGRIERGGRKAQSHYDDGAVYVRPFSDLDRAARFIKAGKRRTLSQEQLKTIFARLPWMRSLKPTPLSRGTTATEYPETVPMPQTGGQGLQTPVLAGAGTGAGDQWKK